MHDDPGIWVVAKRFYCNEISKLENCDGFADSHNDRLWNEPIQVAKLMSALRRITDKTQSSPDVRSGPILLKNSPVETVKAH
jgi:hypothetical protein